MNDIVHITLLYTINICVNSKYKEAAIIPVFKWHYKVKILNDIVHITLLYTINICVNSKYKEATIIPVFKSDDKSLPSNYHPIALIFVLSKIIEKIIRKQVLTFLSHRGYLNNTQHGFRSGRSCLSALLDVYDNIMHMLTTNPQSI